MSLLYTCFMFLSMTIIACTMQQVLIAQASSLSGISSKTADTKTDQLTEANGSPSIGVWSGDESTIMVTGNKKPYNNNNNNKLEKLLALEANHEYQKAKQQDKLKQTLRKKWHKFVDDLIENELEDKPNDSKVGMSLERYRQPKKQLSTSATDERIIDDRDFNSEPINTSTVNKRLANVLVDGTRPDVLSSQISTNDINKMWSDGLSTQQRNQATKNNNYDHARRILDDKFGIMKEAIFTTNNHLGLKGVPKFGSDEDF